MREGWTYKRFEDCLVTALKAKQVQTSEYGSGTKYPIISQEEKLVSGYCDDESLLYHIDRPVVVFGDHTRALKYVDFDFIVGADGVKILIPKGFLKAKFLLYYLQWYNIPNLGYSRHYKLLKEINVPTPHLEIQQSIVAELDKINELIGLKKSQLSDLDSLAQSIFYDMFGDPVENEKGWEVKKLGTIAEFKNGLNFSKNEFGFSCKFLGVSDFQDNRTIYSNSLSEIHLTENISEEYMLQTGDIVFVRSNGSKELVGRNVLIKVDEPTTFSGFCIRCRLANDDCDTDYLSYLLKAPSMRPIITNSGRGCNISNLNQKILSTLPIISPPLPLQQSFAVRIAAIEQQKQRISTSIKDLETLLSSRMQYWFD